MLFRFFRFSMCLSSISHCIQKICSKEMKKIGLKGSYVPYLATLDRFQEEGVTAAKLCELCDRDKAAVSRALSELEEKGLLVREEENGRVYRIRLFLTEKGKRAASFIKEKVQFAVEQAVKGIPEEQRIIFVESFQHISKNLQDLTKEENLGDL